MPLYPSSQQIFLPTRSFVVTGRPSVGLTNWASAVAVQKATQAKAIADRKLRADIILSHPRNPSIYKPRIHIFKDLRCDFGHTSGLPSVRSASRNPVAGMASHPQGDTHSAEAVRIDHDFAFVEILFAFPT
jgi:hypothetical protein